MKSETIQVEETESELEFLSFEEICPEVSGIIAEEGSFLKMRENTYETADGQKRSIMNYNSCLVSEAHGG